PDGRSAEHGPKWQREAARHWHLFEGPHHGPLRPQEDGAHTQIHGPELSYPQRASFARRQRVLLALGTQRRSRGNGRQHEHVDRPLAWAFRTRANAFGDALPTSS